MSVKNHGTVEVEGTSRDHLTHHSMVKLDHVQQVVQDYNQVDFECR